MAKYTIEVELRTHDPAQILRLTEIERFDDGCGYMCRLKVLSHGYGCDRQFFFDEHLLSDAVKALRRMDEGHPGEAVIKGQWEEDCIKFKSNDLGHVFVSGVLPMGLQRLEFVFKTDQTVLRPLIRDFEAILDV